MERLPRRARRGRRPARRRARPRDRAEQRRRGRSRRSARCPTEPAPTATEWEHRAGLVAAYRELRGHDDPTDALGPAPQPGQVEAYAAYRAAWRALGRPEIDREELELSDGQLRIRIRAYEREAAWAPRYVGNELAGTHQAAAHHRQTAALRAAEAAAAADPDRAGPAAAPRPRRPPRSPSILDARAAELQQLDDARARWLAHTAGTRAAADRAKAELAARHVDDTEPEQQVTAEEWLAAHRAALARGRPPPRRSPTTDIARRPTATTERPTADAATTTADAGTRSRPPSRTSARSPPPSPPSSPRTSCGFPPRTRPPTRSPRANRALAEIRAREVARRPARPPSTAPRSSPAGTPTTSRRRARRRRRRRRSSATPTATERADDVEPQTGPAVRPAGAARAPAAAADRCAATPTAASPGSPHTSPAASAQQVRAPHVEQLGGEVLGLDQLLVRARRPAVTGE